MRSLATQRYGRWLVSLAMLCLTLMGLARSGVAAANPATLTTAFREAQLYHGPGETHIPAGLLLPGVEITILERNHTGNWLHVQRVAANGSVALDGWVMTGYLTLHPELRFSDIPVNTTLPDADLSTLDSASLAELYAAPVIPVISDRVREIYMLGQSLGNDARTITKIGDSLSASQTYLTPFSQPDYILGPYDYLTEALAFFGPSTALTSAASRVGLSSLVVFDAMWATDERCAPGESPLACEFRVKQPAVALILFGPNDVLSMDDVTYAGQMRRIVDEALALGIIPVLSTFSVDPDYAYWWQSINFNRALVSLATETEVPLINLWAAARSLPQYGLDEDEIHLAHSGFTYLKFDSGHESWYGVSLQNLLTLRTLDELWRTVMQPEPAASQ